MGNLKNIQTYVENHIPNVVEFLISVLLALMVFVIGVKVIKWLRKIVRKSLERANVDKGVQQFLDSMLKFGLYALLLFSIGKKFGLDTASVAALFASAGVAIGLALQGSLSNFAGGVIILLIRPFNVGDYIEGAGESGTIEKIGMFYTHMTTVDNKLVLIPNGSLANGIIVNYSAKDLRRVDLTFSVGYEQDIIKVKRVLSNNIIHLIKHSPPEIRSSYKIMKKAFMINSSALNFASPKVQGKLRK